MKKRERGTAERDRGEREGKRNRNQRERERDKREREGETDLFFSNSKIKNMFYVRFMVQRPYQGRLQHH